MFLNLNKLAALLTGFVKWTANFLKRTGPFQEIDCGSLEETNALNNDKPYQFTAESTNLHKKNNFHAIFLAMLSICLPT